MAAKRSRFKKKEKKHLMRALKESKETSHEVSSCKYSVWIYVMVWGAPSGLFLVPLKALVKCSECCLCLLTEIFPLKMDNQICASFQQQWSVVTHMCHMEGWPSCCEFYMKGSGSSHHGGGDTNISSCAVCPCPLCRNVFSSWAGGVQERLVADGAHEDQRMQDHSPGLLWKRAEGLLGGNLLPGNYRGPGQKLVLHTDVTSCLLPFLCPMGNRGHDLKDGSSEESHGWMLPGFF